MTTVPAIRAGRRDRHARRRHRARLLAGLLLVRPHLRPGVSRISVPECSVRHDDEVRPAARRRRVGRRVAADSLHAPRTCARSGARWRRPTPIIAVSSTIARDLRAPRAGTRADADLHDPEPGRHGRARRGARPRPAPDGRAVRALRRQARDEQGRAVPAAGAQSRGHHVAARRRRRRAAARRRSKPRRAR